MPSSSSFGINAKNYFLTYPRCSLSPSQALEQIKQLQTRVNKKYIRVCQEQHEDGSPHLHALLQFEATYQCKNNRFFDLVSPNRSAHFHPDLQGAKSSSDVKSYIEKDGVFVEWGEFGVDARSARGGQQTVKEAYAAALNTGSKSMALQTIAELAPRHYVLQLHKLDANLDRIFATPTSDFVSKWDPSSFQIPDDLERWLGEVFKLNDEGSAAQPVQNNGVDRPKSLIIEGESRTGKTAWARSLGPHNYICGYLDLNPKVFKNSVSYNVIDDVTPQDLKLKHWKELLGAKHDWQSKCKYGKLAQIKGGIPSIVLCSPGPNTSYKEFLEKPKNAALKQWTLENAWFVTIKEPLYRSQHQDPTHTGQEKGNTQKTN